MNECVSVYVRLKHGSKLDVFKNVASAVFIQRRHLRRMIAENQLVNEELQRAARGAERREEDASPMSRLSSLPPCHHATMPSCHHVRMHNVTATAGVGVGGAALAGPRRRALVRVGGSDVARILRSGAVGEAIPCPQQVPKPGGCPAHAALNSAHRGGAGTPKGEGPGGG